MLRGEREENALLGPLWFVSRGVGGRPMTQPFMSRMLHAALETRGRTPTLGLSGPGPPPSPSKAPAASSPHLCPWTGRPPFPAQGQNGASCQEAPTLSPPAAPPPHSVTNSHSKARRSPLDTVVSNLIRVSLNPLPLLHEKREVLSCCSERRKMCIWGEEWRLSSEKLVRRTWFL